MNNRTVFRNREEAGRELAGLLEPYKDREDVLVLALPRGGVPVGYEVACALKAPMDICLVRKLGTPGHEELAMGAIASGGVQVINQEVVTPFGIPAPVIQEVARREGEELARLERAYRGDRPAPEIRGRTVILVDDGIATGSTMRAALQALRAQKPAKIIVAVPTAPPSSCREMRDLADEVVAVMRPEPFNAVGQWYEDFNQTTDDEVRELLEDAADDTP
mgnify:CR=1 FL=1